MSYRPDNPFQQNLPYRTWESRSQMDQVRTVLYSDVLEPLDMEELTEAIPDEMDTAFELRDILRKAFLEVRPRERRMCSQWLLEGMTQQEIADLNLITQARVQVLITQGLRQLRHSIYKMWALNGSSLW